MTPAAGPADGRAAALDRVREWFGPALAPEERLLAALATTPFPLTMVNSLIASAKDLVGMNQARILLLTDHAIHVVGRTFWRKRYRRSFASYPAATAPISFDVDTEELRIGSESFFLNPLGLGPHGVGGAEDLQLFLVAGRQGESTGV